MTLEAIWSLQGPSATHNLADALQFVARGGGRHTRHFFFFFGRGAGGLAFLVVPIALGAAFWGYLMKNPDKARGLKERIQSVWKRGAATLNSYRSPTGSLPA